MNEFTQLKYYRKLPFTNEDVSLTLDLYVPHSGQSKVPVIIWIYGGAFRERNNHICPIFPIIERGYAIAQIDYRMSWESVFPAQIIDCKSAVRWLKANADKYGLDADRIGVWGESSGGHLAAMLGMTAKVEEFEVGQYLEYSSGVRAVCDFFGPTDFLKMNAAGSIMDHDAPDSPESQLVGGPIQENIALSARANPISYVHGNVPPFLIVHGVNDGEVPHHQSELLTEALQKVGAQVEFISVPEWGHRHFTQPEIVSRVYSFFDKYLK